MKIILIKENKQPADKRVALTPKQCARMMKQYPELTIGIEPSPERCFIDEEYRAEGIMPMLPSDADILLGIKEIPPAFLIPEKTYLFFSHTIKEQPRNREMFMDIIRKKIRLIDYECLSRPGGGRILGFGHWAGIVGAYNALLVWGKKFGKYELKPAWQCHDYLELQNELKKLNTGSLKIAVTGEGRVAHGVLELLKLAGCSEIHPDDLSGTSEAMVFAHFDYSRLYEHKEGFSFNKSHFYHHHKEYRCLFPDYVQHVDMLINGIYWEKDMDRLFQKEDVSLPGFNIKVIADISCDIEGSVPITLKDTTIGDPVFGFNREDGMTCSPYTKDSIDIMAVSNLPAELPRDASASFGESMCSEILPLLCADPENEIIKNATITENGRLTKTFEYLKEYAGI